MHGFIAGINRILHVKMCTNNLFAKIHLCYFHLIFFTFVSFFCRLALQANPFYSGSAGRKFGTNVIHCSVVTIMRVTKFGSCRKSSNSIKFATPNLKMSIFSLLFFYLFYQKHDYLYRRTVTVLVNKLCFIMYNISTNTGLHSDGLQW